MAWPAKCNPPEKARPPCPICRKPSEAAYRPFCSKRCADVDLQRWLSGRYAVPVVEEDRSARDEPEEGSGG